MKKEFYSAAVTTETNDISTSDIIHYSSSWTWRAVDALSQSKDFEPDPKWIANRLNISAEVAKDALEGLVRIGILRETSEGIKGTDGMTMWGSDKMDRSDYYHIHTKIRDHITSKLTPRECFINGVVLSNKKNVAEFYKKFGALMAELQENSLRDGDANEVFGLELSMARLTRERT